VGIQGERGAFWLTGDGGRSVVSFQRGKEGHKASQKKDANAVQARKPLQALRQKIKKDSRVERTQKNGSGGWGGLGARFEEKTSLTGGVGVSEWSSQTKKLIGRVFTGFSEPMNSSNLLQRGGIQREGYSQKAKS